MLNLSSLLSHERILCQAKISSKKRVLQMLSELLAKGAPELPAEEIFDGLIDRELLGSTGLGYATALPHNRIHKIQEPIAALITLQQGIDFDAPDHHPVDILFALLIPNQCNETHISILGEVAKMFSEPQLREQLHQQSHPEQVEGLLLQWGSISTTKTAPHSSTG